ncbi:23S rRNA (guanosine(2251)-2'-O)-methyltransferase RlmB [Candidatus Zinderia endosymbiont of Aphrophora alni]|uniref:23S rRNA (guanosine(2251)-2'-O)-methyltransferase RlmB n=1 Tax=Candidatus Zinderia endosymbiont of Aphrophora alni TaxID=3077951 RepID=UPI0030CB250D
MKKNIIFGFHSIFSCIKNKFFLINKIYINYNRNDIRIKKILNLLSKKKNLIKKVDKNYLFKISKTNAHQGIVALIYKKNTFLKIENYINNIKKNSLFLILDRITDPHNLGACLRTANCFGVKAVIIAKNKSVKLNSTVTKVSSGASLNIPFFKVSNLINIINLLKKKGVWIIGMDCNNLNKNLYNMNFTGSWALILGSENKGIRQLIKKNCDFLIKIPMFSNIKSLNVSVALGICLYEIKKQQFFLKYKK